MEDGDRGGSKKTKSATTKKQLSARQRLLSLARQEDGIIMRTFPAPSGTGLESGMPPSLASFLKEMMKIKTGIGVISRDRRLEIQTMAAEADAGGQEMRQYALGLVCDVHYPASDELQQKRQDLGPTPPVNEIFSIIENAAECAADTSEEVGWNSFVHAPILKSAIHGGLHAGSASWQQHQDAESLQQGHDSLPAVSIGVTACTTARIIREYLPTDETSGTQVDFCLHLRVDTAAQQRINAIQDSLPMQSISHTNFGVLTNRPIALSFETKKIDSHGGPIKAKLQIGLWHAAQWKLLKRLVEFAQPMQPDNLDSSHVEDQQPELPSFLPAVIICGHDWFFAATTQVQGKTALWTGYPMGDTRDVVGVYQIICGLQRLQAWAKDDYWPWYRRCILKL